MIRCLIFLSLLLHSTIAQKGSENSTQWLTLSGNQPIVIARGGFSGLFPESSSFANQITVSTSLSNVAVLCNLQLTKDGVGICVPDIRIDNSTTISSIYPKAEKSYNVNGQDIRGWFTLDFTADQLLNNVTLTQNIYSRSGLFDGQLPISTVEDVAGIRPPQFWLNVPYDLFYYQHKLSPATFIEQTSKRMIINYLSSPEIGFLKAMGTKVNKQRTKLVFQFLGQDQVEPTTNTKYSAILKNLGSIKSFASAILVPKEYIWPVSSDGYLGSPTSLVIDAHKIGLEVYASGFSNDVPTSYNYSYDPTSEYIQFVDNSQFSVDGVLTDFPPTASEAIACFAHNSGSTPRKGSTLIISNDGASGKYPGCTDLAYQQAVNDGADIIDCSVQLSKDGVPFCLASPDLAGGTTAMMTFIDRKETIPEIQPETGIFSFALTWTEIQTLKPQLVSPFANSSILRNPANKNSGKLLTLAEFLDFARAKAVSGILINIENAGYLAAKQGLDLVETISTALSNATFDKQSTQKVLIQSDDTSVLSSFKKAFASYERVLRIKERFGDAPKPSVEEIAKYANAVTLPRSAVVRVSEFFTVGLSEVVDELKAANLSVYVHELRNEYVTLAFDYFSDPIIEIATYVQAVGVNGIVTDYPGTASKYLRSPCTNTDPKAQVAYPILPAEPGSLLSLIPPEAQPPAPAPDAPLEVDDIVDPPLPAVAKINNQSGNATSLPPGPSKSGSFANVANSVVAILLLGLLSLGC